MVPQHLVLGRGRSKAFSARGAAGRHPSHTPGAWRVLAALRWRSGAALHREREQRVPSLGPAHCEPLCQGLLPRIRHLGPRRGGQPCQGRDQGGRPLCPRRARRRKQDRPPPSVGRQVDKAFGGLEETFKNRIADADEFYDRISPKSLNEDERRVHRQALAGMLWSKQYYYFDLDRWLQEHKSHPLMESTRHGVRNT